MDDPSITDEDCQKILQKLSPGSKLLNFSLVSLAEEVEGYLSTHFKLHINFTTQNSEISSQTFFVKKVNTGFGFLTELASSFDVFTKEIFFYQFYPKLEKMENFINFAPKCYLCKENLIVIENLAETGFEVSEKSIPMSLEKCKVSLETLAKFHGSFIAFEENESRRLGQRYDLSLEYPKELRDFTRNSDENSAVRKYMKASNEVILNLMDEVLDNSIDKVEFKALLLEECLEKNDLYFSKYRKCVLHCDLWNKNFMFQKQDHQIVDCRLLDFQLLNYSLLGYDLAQFLNANTSSEFQILHKESLLQYYYKSLESFLKSLDVHLPEVIPLKDFLDGYILCEPSAKIFSFNDSAVLRIPDTIVEEVFGNVDLLEEFLIDKKPSILLDLYKSSDQFKTWVDSEMKDLYDCLVLKKEFVGKNF